MNAESYTLPEAARVADIPEAELEKAIKDGLLQARFQHNTGLFHISADELARYVRRTRHADPFGRQRKRKVLVLGDDLLFAGTLKLELQREPLIDVRYATWGKDALLMVQNYNADLFVIDLTPTPAVLDEILTAINAQRAKGNRALVAFFAPPGDQIDRYPQIKDRLTQMDPERTVSKKEGMRTLVVACAAALGMDTNTKIMRRAT